jgi:hypothetical protein
VAAVATLGCVPGTEWKLSTGPEPAGRSYGALAWTRVSTTSREARSSSGISVQTLIIASVSSLAAAIVVHKIWQGGAIIGAAVTPIIVGIVGEALRRPVDRLTAVREGGRRLPPEREHDVPPASRQRGDDPFGLWEDRRRRSRGRTWLAIGAVTGILGFAIGAFLLTGSELVFGGSVASPKRTTLFSGGGSSTTTTVQTVVTQTTTTPATVTQTVQTPAPQTATQTVPTTPQEGVAPQQQQQQQAPPATTTTPGATGPTTPAPAP